jgi:hypothetical protein
VFNERERKMLNKLGFSDDMLDNPSDDIYIENEEKAGDFLTLESLDENYMPNEEGRICEAILDKLADI